MKKKLAIGAAVTGVVAAAGTVVYKNRVKISQLKNKYFNKNTDEVSSVDIEKEIESEIEEMGEQECETCNKDKESQADKYEPTEDSDLTADEIDALAEELREEMEVHEKAATNK